MSVRKEHDLLDEDQIEEKMQRKEIEPAVLNIENHSTLDLGDFFLKDFGGLIIKTIFF